MKPPMTQKDFNEQATKGCGDPTCTKDHHQVPMGLLGSCCENDPERKEKGLQVFYLPPLGELHILCGACKGLVAKILVAPDDGKVVLDKAFSATGQWKARKITTAEGPYLNLTDMKRHLSDETLVESCAAVLKIGMERGQPIEAVRACVGNALFEFAGAKFQTKGAQ